MNINVFLKKNEDILINKTYSGNFDNGIIKYNDGIINTFDTDSGILSRYNSDYTIHFDFKKKNGYCIFDNNNFSFPIEVIKFNISSNEVYINYIFNDEHYLYSLNWR